MVFGVVVEVVGGGIVGVVVVAVAAAARRAAAIPFIDGVPSCLTGDGPPDDAAVTPNPTSKLNNCSTPTG
jgi:hypothetical protein